MTGKYALSQVRGVKIGLEINEITSSTACTGGTKSSLAVMEGAPSKVLHIRNLPEECTEMDLRSLSAQFGIVVRVLFLSRKQQAFVEFSTVEEAALMLATSQAQPIRLGTRSC